jgi:hypothetical protein
VFTLLRLLIPVVLIVAVVAGSLTLVSRASCRSGTGRETRWSLGAPGAKPDSGCRDQQTGLSYLLDQVGLG